MKTSAVNRHYKAIRAITAFMRRAVGGREPDEASPDYASEVQWWDSYLAKRPDGIWDPGHRERAFPKPLIAHLTSLRGRKNGRVKVLEVGSGPVSLLAWGVDQGLCEVTAVDPLAKQYEMMMARYYGRAYPIVPVEGIGEALLTLFDRESFDAVYSSNALDHASSPRACLRAISLVVRRGGIVCVEGFTSEGTYECWRGLHQHDLVPAPDDLVHCDKQGVYLNLTRDLKLRCLDRKAGSFSERAIDSFGYEWTGAAPTSPWHGREWYTMLFEATYGNPRGGELTGK